MVHTRKVPTDYVGLNLLRKQQAKEATELLWDTISQDADVHSYLSATGSRWTFIVELSPWMGGIYERMVQVVKRALRKSIGRKCLSTTELLTVLTEAQAICQQTATIVCGRHGGW